MWRTMLKSELHRATVTHTDPAETASVTVDAALLEAADLLPGEQVTVLDPVSGARRDAYAMSGERNSGVVAINGPAAALTRPGSVVTVVAYGVLDDAEARAWEPNVVLVDADNIALRCGVGQRCGHDPRYLPEAVTVPDSIPLPEPGNSEPVDAETDDAETVNSETDDAAKLDALLHQPGDVRDGV